MVVVMATPPLLLILLLLCRSLLTAVMLCVLACTILLTVSDPGLICSGLQFCAPACRLASLRVRAGVLTRGSSRGQEGSGAAGWSLMLVLPMLLLFTTLLVGVSRESARQTWLKL